MGGKGYLTPKGTNSPEAGASFHFLYLSTPASCCRRKWPHSTQPEWNWRECFHCYAGIVSAKNQPPDKLWMTVVEGIRGRWWGGRMEEGTEGGGMTLWCCCTVLLKQLESWERDKWHTALRPSSPPLLCSSEEIYFYHSWKVFITSSKLSKSRLSGVKCN